MEHLKRRLDWRLCRDWPIMLKVVLSVSEYYSNFRVAVVCDGGGDSLIVDRM